MGAVLLVNFRNWDLAVEGSPGERGEERRRLDRGGRAGACGAGERELLAGAASVLSAARQHACSARRRAPMQPSRLQLT